MGYGVWGGTVRQVRARKHCTLPPVVTFEIIVKQIYPAGTGAIAAAVFACGGDDVASQQHVVGGQILEAEASSKDWFRDGDDVDCIPEALEL